MVRTMGSLNRAQRAALRRQFRKFGITTRRKRGLRGEGIFSALGRLFVRTVAPRLTKAGLKAGAKAAAQAAKKAAPKLAKKMAIGAAAGAASGLGGMVIKKTMGPSSSQTSQRRRRRPR